VQERKLADLEAQIGARRVSNPKVIPHPAAIAPYVQPLAETVEQEDRAPPARSYVVPLPPFATLPQVDGYRMSAPSTWVCLSRVVAGA
jgi:hypothetical protein